MRSVQAKYKGKKIIATGHSLGGAKALYAGKHFGVETVAFNPGPLNSNGKPCEQCTVVRTRHDPISLEAREIYRYRSGAKGRQYVHCTF